MDNIELKTVSIPEESWRIVKRLVDFIYHKRQSDTELYDYIIDFKEAIVVSIEVKQRAKAQKEADAKKAKETNIFNIEKKKLTEEKNKMSALSCKVELLLDTLILSVNKSKRAEELISMIGVYLHEGVRFSIPFDCIESLMVEVEMLNKEISK